MALSIIGSIICLREDMREGGWVRFV